MLTRLKVSGFKNLVDVDLRLGPFTCIAGANAVGKSNLFDAIYFLSQLADRPLLEAALAVRGANRRVRNLLYSAGEVTSTRMRFEVEMIVPTHAKDDLSQQARASSTFLRYRLELALRSPAAANLDRGAPRSGDELEILEERLEYITKGEAYRHLLFEHRARSWRDSVVINQKKGECFISTVEEEGDRIVRLHQDGGGSRGRPLSYLASTLPRTLVSSANAAESPTALLARREMQSWRLFQLEPSALRLPDDFAAPSRLGDDGAHLAATLDRLERFRRLEDEGRNGEGQPGQVYAEVAGRLAELIDDVRTISVDRDEKRELLTLQITNRSGGTYPAPALSDGTLRFLGLAILAIDPEARGLLCLEEPENGVHPQRVPAVLMLLQDIAVDPMEPVDADNPLRQVIVNTHSPSVVKLVPEDSLILACPQEHLNENGDRLRGVSFRPLRGTWRTQDEEVPPVALGELLTYLNPVPPSTDELFEETRRGRRVMDRLDVQGLLPFPDSSG